MSRVEIRDLGEPEAVVTYPLGATYQVRLAGTVISHHVLQPGWSWEVHARPQVGTSSCELYHRGIVLSGRMGVRTDEGDEVVIGPHQVFDLPPGHVTWVEGDEELIMVDWAGGAGFDVQPGESARVMATILFTDMVGSTAQAQEAGDAAWRQTMTMHDDVVRTVLVGFGGRRDRDRRRLVSDRVRRRRARNPLRTGAGRGAGGCPGSDTRRDPQRRGDADRRPRQRRRGQCRSSHHGRGRPGEVLVCGTTCDLAEGATGLAFTPRGRHRLNGLEREYSLFAAASSRP